MKKLLSILLAVTLFAGVGASAAFSDVSEHWAKQSIDYAEKTGILNGYGDGSFRPDDIITGAELVKVILASMKLTPGSVTAEYLHASSYYGSTVANGRLDPISDLDDNWLTAQGWTQIALNFGLIFPTDYADHKFWPDSPISRYDAALMFTRMMGLVYPAENYDADWGPLTVPDAASIPDWVKGYVYECLINGVIEGHEDGSFRGGSPLTRAEAVTMALRAVSWSEQGADEAIQVFAMDANYLEETYGRVSLTAPVQIVDGYVYVPARNLFDAVTDRDYYHDYEVQRPSIGSWGRIEGTTLLQQYSFECGKSIISYIAGTTLTGSTSLFPPRGLATYRILRGEFMIAVCKEDEPYEYPDGLIVDPPWFAAYDTAAKTLSVDVRWRFNTGS
jgi:hypothetical protein